MSNLYRVRSTLPEIGAHFGVDGLPELQVPWETNPEMPGLVNRGVEGERTFHEMRWGFPRTKLDARVGREVTKAMTVSHPLRSGRKREGGALNSVHLVCSALSRSSRSLASKRSS